jgi:perosamine synthetase
MEKLLAIGKKTGVKIIEDAAEAIGSVFHGKPAGALGDFGVFSFHGTKTLSTGEGGMLVTNDSALYERVRLLSNHGRSSAGGPQFWPEVLGYKYKMTNIQAAMGCAQTSRVDELVARKREILDFYRKELRDLDYVGLNAEHDGTKVGAWMPNLVFSKASGIRREHLVEEFQRAGIDARVFFWPLTSTPPFSHHPTGNSPVSYSIAERSINLPSYHDITQSELNRVVSVVKGLRVKT